MNQHISNYIQLNKVFTIATSVDNKPYCANCYYAYDKASKTLLFLSDQSTRHIKEAITNNKLAGTIQNGVTTVAKIQGIQFTGDFLLPNELEQQQFYKIYYDKFPFAKARPSAIWGIQLNWIKMTNNTLGFGKKLFWERENIS